ncbi:uncharacterized protein LAESUDRAFT_649386 [Laetiporus sulphureus 93-53]|uniref:Uncharacterized protein n=1 Tax=Laetiporus sulphureus 93-53 TaxID=1314785 RepID=A0A165F5H0_9APHY|nr:uncharacterized protein LAESUDRAFT_649386 [Laetiporus sulphureus 93-53]KZT08429.1 hypothetical protein LAESUDRAFT_649386 [Laetiporus sulphureus 93-53]
MHQRQYPIIVAYALTDYRSQGQTMKNMFIDMARPPTGKLSLFNLYVVLSCSHGRKTIWILRNLNENMFHEPHDERLLMEDE